jgi:DNA-binding HxlR family transcriptional regulator
MADANEGLEDHMLTKEDEVRSLLQSMAGAQEAWSFFKSLLDDLDKVGTGVEAPVQSVLKHVTSYWGSAILYILRCGTFRHAELRRLLSIMNDGHSISQRMLTRNLRTLERDGLVERRVHAVKASHVDYRLTEMGRELSERLEAMITSVVHRHADIIAARDRFDSEHLD